jgi:uncharacterized membrane protein
LKLSYLIRGTPGHPLHPPLTDATIGAYTAALVAGLASVVGIAADGAAHAYWLALVIGLIISAPTAVAGFADWLLITWWTPLWRTATLHMAANVIAAAIFAAAAVTGHSDYTHAAVSSTSFVLAVIGFGVLTLGGWLGGTIVFVHGMRVLGMADKKAAQAVSPLPDAEEEAAEG